MVPQFDKRKEGKKERREEKKEGGREAREGKGDYRDSTETIGLGFSNSTILVFLFISLLKYP